MTSKTLRINQGLCKNSWEKWQPSDIKWWKKAWFQLIQDMASVNVETFNTFVAKKVKPIMVWDTVKNVKVLEEENIQLMINSWKDNLKKINNLLEN